MAISQALLSFVSLSLTATVLAGAPPELQTTRFAETDLTPSPACLSVSADGTLFVGLDLNGRVIGWLGHSG